MMNQSSQVQSDSQKSSGSDSAENKNGAPKDVNLASFAQFVHPDLSDIDSGEYWLPEIQLVENSEIHIVNQRNMSESEARELFVAISTKDKKEN